jgi:hypothetical protein
MPINVRYAPDSDRSRHDAIAKSVSTTPASGGISCRGYQASDFNRWHMIPKKRGNRFSDKIMRK